jgi:hypothetical protein
MKVTKYILKNNSRSEGTYLIDGEYKIIYPNEEISLQHAPTNKTANVTLIVYKKEVKDDFVKEPLSKKVRR